MCVRCGSYATGRPWDAAWYAEVAEACALLQDFAELSDGDATEIGDRGVNLSGGQKARVGLWRVRYPSGDRDRDSKDGT